MVYWLLGAIGVDILLFILGFVLHGPYLKHLRLHQRPYWEDINRRSPRSWRYFKGMPTTGLLISTFITDREFKEGETTGKLWLGRLIVALNLLHIIALGAILILSALVLLS
ncbi:MAG: hypothetical protein ACI9DF_001292 [Verrucomicrobiales bacterium]|jgi:hypothetical protein